LNRQGAQIFEKTRIGTDEGAGCSGFFSRGRSTTIASNLQTNGRKQSARSYSNCWRGKRRRTAHARCEDGTSLKTREETMVSSELELLRLEEVLRLARDRLAGIIRMVPDPAVVKAAEDLCAEAVAAVGAYRWREPETRGRPRFH
jgi:hypothetical protein